MESTPGRQWAATMGGYALLFLLGGMEALIGCFQYSRSMGAVPVAALISCLVVFASCLLAGRGMGTPLGGLAVALGWLFVSLALTLPTPGGSVIITNTAAGKWYLYGGAVAAAVGVVAGLRVPRTPPAHPPGSPPQRPPGAPAQPGGPTRPGAAA